MRPAALAALSLSLAAQEVATTHRDQKAMAVTIYNDDLALVKDLREVALPKGEGRLAFEEVSAKIRPETAQLRSVSAPNGFFVVEQNFDFDLLTPGKLLEKYVGRKVTVVRDLKPQRFIVVEEGQAKLRAEEVITEDGKEVRTVPGEWREEAVVLATSQGPVLQFADGRIETSVPGRLVFDKVPDNLRAKPTLVVTLNSGTAHSQALELSYLTSGLGWKADYVANLAPDEATLDLAGWVTLTNQSGAAYPDATLQLVAGEVHRAPEEELRRRAPGVMMDMAAAKAAPPEMKEESLFEYHLYTLDRPTTIQSQQTKQVALLSAAQVPLRKEYVLKGETWYYQGRYDELGERLKTGVFVEFDDTEAARLGKPLPKGVVRVYKRDSEGRAQFVGEDRIEHTPKGETVRLRLGDAFDVTARRKQVDYKSLGRQGKYAYVFETAYEVVVRNAKKDAVTVSVVEPMPGDWEILQESHPHTKETSGAAKFRVPVPAGGSATLSYRVRTKW